MSSVSLRLGSTFVINFDTVEAFVVEIPATLASKALRYDAELFAATILTVLQHRQANSSERPLSLLRPPPSSLHIDPSAHRSDLETGLRQQWR